MTMAANASPGILGGTPVQKWARTIAVLCLLSLIAGAFGEAYVQMRLMVPNDAAATLHNLASHDLLYRLGFAAYLVEGVCDVMLAVAFYVVLKPVHRNVALMAALLGVVSTAVYAVSEGFYMLPAMMLRSRAAFGALTDDQLSAMVLMSLKTASYIGSLFVVFYGVATVLRGWLIVRSTFLPSWLGVLMIVAGAGFIANTYALVLAPGRISLLVFAVPMFAALLAMIVWFGFRGVDVARWREAAGERT